MSESGTHRLFLLDGMALIYRAHFAFITNPMRAHGGMNVSALFGFLNTLLLLRDTGKPTHLAVAFDTSEPTDRHKLYPAYKAHRESMPEELSAQIPHLFDFLEALRIPIIRLPGYEADDTIGTLAKKAEAQGSYLTYMVTPDKDFGQLVSPTSLIWKPGRKGNDYTIITLEKLREIWDIQRPEQVIDILALMGDASDNIPGIPGIGEKTAKQLIRDFDSLDTLLSRTDELKGKRKELVETHAEQARLSRTLATINTEVPLTLTPDELICQAPNAPILETLLNEFNFRSLHKRFLSPSPNTSGDAHTAAVNVSSAPSSLGTPAGALSDTPLGTPSGKTSSTRKKKQALPPEEDLLSALLPPDPSASVQNEATGTNDSPHATDTSAPDGDGSDLFSYGAQQAAQASRLRTLKDTPHQYTLVDTDEKRDALIQKLLNASSWCFDTETTGLDPLVDKLLGIAFCLEEGEAYYVPIYPENITDPWEPVFRSSSEKIGHNLKFDIRVLLAHGLPVEGPIFDTMIAHALLAPGHKHSMDYLAEVLLNYETITLESITPKNLAGDLDMIAIPTDTLAEYACEDADVTFRLAQILGHQLNESNLTELYRKVEAPLVPVLAAMEQEGIALDTDKLATLGQELNQELITLTETIIADAGEPFNLNSPKQLGNILFDKLQLVAKPKKTKTGQYVTDEETLASLADKHPIIDHILSYRESNKLKNTYVDALPRFLSPADHRIHTNLLQLVTATGRIASQDPNLQNIPIRSQAGKNIRAAFIPRNEEYTLLSADYSQIELRIMAALSGDAGMIDAFRSGRDIHTETAARIFSVSSEEITPDMRRAAKTVNFGIIYGISAFGLSQRLAIPRGRAADIIGQYFEQFPGIKAFMDKTIDDARACGYVTTLCGRKRVLPEITSANANIRQGAERIAVNTPIQGSAADMIKIAMTQVHHLLREKATQSKLLLQIHDELVFDLHVSEHHLIAEIVRLMIHALPLPHEVPVIVDAHTGANWLDAH